MMNGEVRSMSEDSEGASYSRCRPVSTCCSFGTARGHFFPEAQTRRKQVDPLLTLRSPAPYKDPSLFLNRFRFSRRPPCCPLLACSGCLADSVRTYSGKDTYSSRNSLGRHGSRVGEDKAKRLVTRTPSTNHGKYCRPTHSSESLFSRG